jgi:hypothetical protein
MPALLKRWDFWFGLLGSLGLLFAVFTYVVTNKIGRVSYSFDTQKVFDPANLSGFALVTADKVSVEKPVYATDVVIWNSGDLSLSDNSDRVREPLKINLNGVIYYYIVSRINLVDPTNYRIELSQDRSAVTITWKFFDPNQGIRLTLLHSDDGEPKVELSGRFFDASLHRESERKPIRNDAKYVFLSVGLIAIAFGIVTLFYSRLRMAQVAVGNDPSTKLSRRISFLRLMSFLSAIVITEGLTVIGLAFFAGYFSRVPPV